MRTVTVTDPSDERLADLRGLRAGDDAVSRRGIVVAESITIVARLLAQRRPLRTLVVTPSMLARVSEHSAEDQEILVVERDVVDEVVGFPLHRGVIATLDRPSEPDPDAILRTATTVVVLEGINDPENLGAIARSALALGADAVMLDPRCIDPWRRRVVRVSMGAILDLDVIRSRSWPEDLDDLTRRGFITLGLTPHRDAATVDDVTIGSDDRVAVVMGAEGPGLDAETLARVQHHIRIPMRDEIDSLNVAHATTAILALLRRTSTIDT